MSKNEKVQRVQRKKKNKTSSKDKPVQELQKNKADSTSTDATATSDKQQNPRNRERSLQQEKSNPNDAGDKRIIQVYKKIKCIFCGYEMASLAERPTCSKCGRRRFDKLTTFSVTKPNKLKGGVNMAKETEAEKSEEKKKVSQDEEADELDTLFD